MSPTTFSAEFVNPPKHVSSNLIQIIFCYAIKCINSLVRLPNVISFHIVAVSNFVISNIIKRHIFIINKTSISELVTKQGIKEMQSKDQLRRGHGYLTPFSTIFQLSLVEEIGVPGENHRPAASHWHTLSHHVVSSTSRMWTIWKSLLLKDHLPSCFRYFVAWTLYEMCFKTQNLFFHFTFKTRTYQVVLKGDVSYVNIGWIVDHHCLSFLLIRYV